VCACAEYLHGSFSISVDNFRWKLFAKKVLNKSDKVQKENVIYALGGRNRKTKSTRTSRKK